MRILVVEDEKRLAGTLADLLHRQGYTVDVSNDGVSGSRCGLMGVFYRTRPTPVSRTPIPAPRGNR